jgi:hypothetical protein
VSRGFSMRGLAESRHQGGTATSRRTGDAAAISRRAYTVVLGSALALFGSSWTALILSLSDLEKLLAGERGLTWGDILIAVATVIIIVMIGVAARVIARDQLAIWSRVRVVEDHGLTCEEACLLLAEAMEDRRQLKAQNAAIAEATIAAVVPKIENAIRGAFKPEACGEPMPGSLPQAPPQALVSFDSPLPGTPPRTMALAEPSPEAGSPTRGEGALSKKKASPKEKLPSPELEDPSLGAVTKFTSERVIRSPGDAMKTEDVFAAYEQWCATRGKKPVGLTAFTLKLKELGHEKRKIHGGLMRWTNIALRADTDDASVVVKFPGRDGY